MKVIHVRDTKKHTNVVYIGRTKHYGPSGLGNPYSIGYAGRDACIKRYKEYIYSAIKTDKVLREQLAGLYRDDKTLACHCAPSACHGDVLIEASKLAYKYVEGLIKL